MTLSAVITADIVKSTQLPRANYKKLLKNLETLFRGHQYEFFRGDSFQVFLESPHEALRILLRARTAAMKLSETSSMSDVRASIGISTVKLPVKSFQTAVGDVFVLSGRAFDQLEMDERLTIVSDDKNTAVNLGLIVISQFIDYLFQRLTFKQAAVVHELLMQRTQIETARLLQKSQATINRHTQAAGWPELEKLLTKYKDLIGLIQP
ncbi:MAG: hypothetical protein ACXVBX_09745 [Flavisolibacter sp.]